MESTCYMNILKFRWIKLCSLLVFLSGITGCYDESQTADPVVEDFPVAYVKRPVPLDNQNNPRQTDVTDLAATADGGDLYIKRRAAPGTPEENITFRFTQGRGDVKDLESSYDGERLIFAMRAPEEEDQEAEPTWNIWEYRIPTDELRRIISSDIVAEAGHDIAPHYLPDGRIVFSSTRQRKTGAILIDEGKSKYPAETEDLDGPAFVLHVMDENGENIRQISFNQSHDLDPTVISSGEIVFSRWDNAGNNNAINLYKVRPDGTELEILYGAHSHNTGSNNSRVQFLQPREISDGRFVTAIKPFRSTDNGGNIITIDVENYIDNQYPTNTTLATPDYPAQDSLVDSEILTNSSLSPNGRYRSVYPLWDGTDRLLVSWTPCRLMEDENIVPCTPERLQQPDAQAAPPLYGAYIYNPASNTHIPLTVPQEGVIIEEIMALEDKTPPPVLYDKQPGNGLDNQAYTENTGILHIRSVYDVDGIDTAQPDIRTLADPAQTNATQRPAHFLRIVKAVAIPEDLVDTARGRSNQLLREIIGYVPIEPDGSVMARVPANVPLMISILDAQGRRISPRHNNWIQVMPGEEKHCNGCHEHNNGTPHGRQDGPPSIYSGALTSGLPFPNTDPTLIANMGETMAQTRARISCETDCQSLYPAVDIVFEDYWNSPAQDTSIAYRYADLQTTAPASANCQTEWNSLCRTIINYRQHVEPIWEISRTVLNTSNEQIDGTCNTCHNSRDADGNFQLPAGVRQIDLSDRAHDIASEFATSYRELMFNDNEQVLEEGQLVDLQIPVFLTDENNNQVLDENGQPIPLAPLNVVIQPVMSSNSANSSSVFFNTFAEDGAHPGWLSDAELRLISEWLDIGAQYHNDPFYDPNEAN